MPQTRLKVSCLWFLFLAGKKRTINCENVMNIAASLEIINVSDIQPKKVKWLSYPHILLGIVKHLTCYPVYYTV